MLAVFENVPVPSAETASTAAIGGLIVYLLVNVVIPWARKKWNLPSPAPTPAPVVPNVPVDPTPPVDPNTPVDNGTPLLDAALDIVRRLLKSKLFTVTSDGFEVTEADLAKEVLQKHL